MLRDLQAGHSVPGPAIVLDDISTVVVEPGCTAHVTPAGDLRVEVGSASAGPYQAPIECDPIQLAIFSHRCACCISPLHTPFLTHNPCFWQKILFISPKKLWLLCFRTVLQASYVAIMLGCLPVLLTYHMVCVYAFAVES